MHPRERETGSTKGRVTIAVIFVLVVAVLIGLMIRGKDSTDRRPRSPTSATTVRNIVSALKSYHNDYGKFPPIDVKALQSGKKTICFGDPACKISDGPNSLLFDVLRAIPREANANHQLNRRQQKYFEMGKAKDPKAPRDGFADGSEYPEALQGCLLDPWGRQYCIVFTMDDSDAIDLSAIYSDLAGPEHLIRVPIAVFSLGKDGIPGGKGYEGKLRKPSSNEPPDDIVSWQ